MRTAVASPMPLLAPVMATTLPWVPDIGFSMRQEAIVPSGEWLTKFFDNFFPRLTISRIMVFESRNAMEAGMADAGDGAGIVGGEKRPAPQEMAMRALRMLERLVAGSSLTEVAAGEGLTPRRARELVAEVVAQRGFDP